MELITDWKCYELILFNILQNAIKFNRLEGDIVIILKVNPVKSNINLNDSVNSINISALIDTDESYYMLETEVIDTGIGISKKRQEMLFVPF